MVARLTRGLEHLELGEAEKELLRLASIEEDRGLSIVPCALELEDLPRTKTLVKDTAPDVKRSE